MSRLRILVENKDDHQILRLVGKIDEDSNFHDVKLKKTQNLIIDFADVAGINSCGIREWINFIQTIPTNIEVSLIDCDSFIIEQINMIEDFLPANAFIKSFRVPYYCDNCDEQSNILLTRENKSETEVQYEDIITCQSCKGSAEIDILKNKFFNFLKKF